MINILLVDDDPNMEKAVSLFLERSGMTSNVVRAGSKMEADKFLLSNTFDMFIVDHRLPDGPGVEWLYRHSNKPFLYATFYLDDEIKAEVESMGGLSFDKNEMINHPRELCHKVQEALAA